MNVHNYVKQNSSMLNSCCFFHIFRNMEICIKIPIPKKSFSLYVQGIILNAITTDQETFLILDSNYPITLYYKIMGRRKIYVCSSHNLGSEYVRKHFPESNLPLSVACELSGRAFDRFKKSIRLLEKIHGNSILKKGIDFFIRLSELCSSGKNSLPNLELLMAL